MTINMKIRTRLTLQFILITASIFTLVLFFIFRQFQQYIENEFYVNLESKARMTAEMVLRHESEIVPIAKVTSDNRVKLPSIGNTTIYNEHLQCVFTLNTSADWVSENQLKQIKTDNSYRFTQDNFQAVGVSLYTSSGKRYIVVSEDIPDFSKLLTLRNILLLSFFLAIAAVAAGGWFYAGQALIPVSHIVSEVDDILPADLSRRLKINNNHDELSHLVKTFNRLLDRIEQAFQMQKGFISNVSHELKNPIATMDAQLQLARNKPRTIQEYDRVLGSLHEDVKEISDTADKLLQLAKIHSDGTQIEFSIVRVDELIYQSRDVLLKTNPSYSVNIEIKKLPENEEELCTYGNEFLLRSALINLLDNCCKFSDDHKASVIIDFNSKHQLQIRDKGQGISTEDLPFIFEPFFRGAQNGHKKGSGIGLSLVKSILQLHHISIEVESSLNLGTNFSLYFPNQEYIKTQLNRTSIINTLEVKQGHKSLKKAFKMFFFVFFISILGLSCSDSEKYTPPQYQQGFEVVQDWNSMLLDLVQYSSGYRPPVSARMYAYMGLAAWETSLPSLKNAQSLSPIYPDLKIPIWDNKVPFIAPAALNATYSTLSKHYFPHTPYTMQQKQKDLFGKWEKKLSDNYSIETIDASKKYGHDVAEAIFKWSSSDTIGHQAFLFNYHPNYKPPTSKGSWGSSNSNLMPALLPYWGAARTFAVAINEIAAKPPITYSEEKNTAFFAQAMEVYSSSKPVSEEKRWIAEYWSDDYPNISFCAASRWISIAHQALEIQHAQLSLTLETYLKLGIALNDVAVKTWYEKYYFNVERPDTYIQRNIDANWQPLHDTPPFPTYPSGHSSFGAAASVVLSNLLSPKLSMTDYSHQDSKIFIGTPRSFNSFKAMAEENALSRIFIGVHYRMDCEEGIRLGTLIGEKVSALKVKTEDKWVQK
jgi:signal transduction histidine kinase